VVPPGSNDASDTLGVKEGTEPAELPEDEASRRRRARLTWAVVAVMAVAVSGAAGFSLWGQAEGAGPKSGMNAEVPVRVAPAAVEDLELRAARRGELDADAAELSARSGGYLTTLSVRIGDEVKKGALLAQVEPTQAHHAISEALADAAAARAEKKRIAAELAAAEVEHERGKKALEKALISAKEALALESRVAVLRAQLEAQKARESQVSARVDLLRERLSDTSLTAPFDGAVAARYVDEGSMVQPGKAILRLVKKGPLTVRFRIPEREIGLVRVGMEFEVTTQATGAKRFAGRLVRIAAELSRVDRTVAVEGVLAEETPLLRPGMYASVTLELGELENAVVVPSGSV
jgi:membrane fusion protein (multidrug efflux system)/multidrug efflux system membrane fusion protein